VSALRSVLRARRVPTAVVPPRTARASRGLAAVALCGAIAAALGAVSSPAARAQQGEVYYGTVRQRVGGCAEATAQLVLCDTGAILDVRSDVPLEPYVGFTVRIEGTMRACPGGGTYLQLQNVGPSACGSPQPTPQPTPAGQPRNLALGGIVLASTEGLPGRGPEAINDGNPATDWAVPPGRAAWARLDLLRDEVFNQVVLRWGATHATRYALYAWDPSYGDGGDWIRIYQTQDGRGGTAGVEVIPLARAEARHLLLYLVDSSDPAQGFSLAEWEVYGAATPNLALAGEALVSSAASCCPGWHALDGDRATTWISDPARDERPANPYLFVRFPTRIDISEIRLYWHGGQYPYLYRVALYQGERLLPTGFGVENPNGGRDRISWPGTFSVDGVLIFTDRIVPGADRIALEELELYAEDPGAELADRWVPAVEGATLRWWSAAPIDDPRALPSGLGDLARLGVAGPSATLGAPLDLDLDLDLDVDALDAPPTLDGAPSR